MPKKIPIKNHQEEVNLITHRTITTLVVMVMLIAVLIIRLIYLQLVENDLYSTLSKKNWLDLVPVEPNRGLIYDRKGVLLAYNVPIFSLDIIPSHVENLPKTLADIARIIPLSDTDIAQFRKILKQHRRFDEIPLKFRLSEQDVANFYENQYRFPGVLVKARLMRSYPLGSTFSHLLGYVGRISPEELDNIDLVNYSASNYIGKSGIEKFYEDELHGTVGYEQAESDVSGEAVRVLNQIKPVPGKTLYLTIDSGLQLAAEQAMQGHRGAVIAIDPNNGQVLAMLSEPGFDPNIFVAGISNQDFQQLQQSPDRPLYNRAVRGLYPFASTVKPYLALEGLESETVDEDFSIQDPGWYRLKNRVFHDWRPHGHGVVNISKAITQSCDIYFYTLAAKMGIQHIDSILNAFGFGKATGIDLDDELPGNVPSPAWKRREKGEGWYPGDTVITAIGQGFMQATPLQIANGVAAIAMRGKRFQPYLLLSEKEANIKQTAPEAPTPLEPVKLKDEDHWDTIIDAMRDVVETAEGTAYYRFGQNHPYIAAGKTGTAQVYSRKRAPGEEGEEDQSTIAENLRDHSLFVAFAPIDHPKIAVAVIVENTNLAVGVARKVLDYYLVGPPPPPLPAGNTDNATKEQ